MTDKLLPLVPGDDAVPRVQDVVIGERLGLARPTNVRQTIEANMAELEGFGLVHAARAPITNGKGRVQEVTEYHLSEEQALLVCALSRTAKAAEVRRDLILTYTAYRRGQLGGAIDPRQMGGIMKSVVRAQIKEALTELAPQIIAAQLAADPRVAAIRAVTALEIAQDEGVPRKGRHPIVVSISKRLKKYCLARGHDPDKQPGKSAKLFPVEYAYAWLREEGREFIRRRIADAAEPAPLFAIRGGKH